MATPPPSGALRCALGATYESAQSAHGPTVAAWVRGILERQVEVRAGRQGSDHGEETNVGAVATSEELPDGIVTRWGPTFERTLRRWEAGSFVCFYVLDRWLLHVGLFLPDVPPEAWSPYGAKLAARIAAGTSAPRPATAPTPTPTRAPARREPRAAAVPC